MALQKESARKFAEYWKGKGYEKGQSQPFWLSLLREVFGVHMAWMRLICGRIKSDYRYSKDIVYNNFPWPHPTDAQIEKISQTAQAILDARSLYPESSLANLYDELAMPIELRKAHRANDAAVLEAYGFPKDATESDMVARLFQMYQTLTDSATSASN